MNADVRDVALGMGYDFALLRGVVEVNEQQRDRVISKIERAVGGDLAGARNLLDPSAMRQLGFTYQGIGR